jgi:hypothetical protein
MRSQRWSKLVSVLVFGLVLATAGTARAQWGFPVAGGYPAVSQFGVGYGAYPGISPFGYGSYGAGGYVGGGNFIGFPMPGYAESLGQVPLTTTAFPSLSDAVTLIPARSGSTYRAYHRNRARPVVPRAANPQ